MDRHYFHGFSAFSVEEQQVETMNSQGGMLYRIFHPFRKQDISSTIPTWKLTQPTDNASRGTYQQLHSCEGF
jgi:hypothetical protein